MRELQSYFTWLGKTIHTNSREDRSTQTAPSVQPAAEVLWSQNPTGEKTERCKERQKKKFDTLLDRTLDGTHPCRPNNRWVVNLSSRPLSAAEEGVLARGQNFAPASQRIPVPEIVAVVEGGLSRVPSSQAQLARTRIAGCLAKIQTTHHQPHASRAEGYQRPETGR